MAWDSTNVVDTVTHISKKLGYKTIFTNVINVHYNHMITN